MSDRRRREAQADLACARQILATALDKPRKQIDGAAALIVVGWTRYIADLLAMPAAAWLLGTPARDMLAPLSVVPDVFLTNAFKEFRDGIIVLREEAAFERLPDGADPARRLLMRLLAFAWQHATGRRIAGSDRGDGPLARFLLAMVDPATGLPSLTQTPAARSACDLTDRKRLREALARRAPRHGPLKPRS